MAWDTLGAASGDDDQDRHTAQEPAQPSRQARAYLWPRMFLSPVRRASRGWLRPAFCAGRHGRIRWQPGHRWQAGIRRPVEITDANDQVLMAADTRHSGGARIPGHRGPTGYEPRTRPVAEPIASASPPPANQASATFGDGIPRALALMPWNDSWNEHQRTRRATCAFRAYSRDVGAGTALGAAQRSSFNPRVPLLTLRR